ncbi:MAG: hypothetical protein AAF770_00775 [Bacteroidota bacterium]
MFYHKVIFNKKLIAQSRRIEFQKQINIFSLTLIEQANFAKSNYLGPLKQEMFRYAIDNRCAQPDMIE